ncbi:MAG: hypothetical protein IID45_13515, partial [Planctomycetes bacterium]|nr:hypothetical protein [Planctomycetota bacterium]
MKFSAPDFKNLDYKQLLLDHGEKFAVGLAGLIVLFALLGTPWTPYQEAPAKLQQDAKDADARISAAKWPDEERRKYSAADILGVQLALMGKPIDLDRLKFTTDLSFRLYRDPKRHDDPKFRTIEFLIASSHRFSILEHSDFVGTEDGRGDMGSDSGMGGNGREKPAGTGTPGKVRVRKPAKTGTGSGDTPMGAGGDTTPMSGSGYGPPQGGPSGNPGGAAAAQAPTIAPGGMDDMGMGGEGGEVSSGQPHGRNVVAVRGIFNIYKQMAAYIQALDLNLSLDNPGDRAIVRSKVVILNFRLQRRVSLDGGKTWGNWQMVDIKPALDYFANKVAEWETDVVEQRVTHHNLTFPLPRRLRLVWGAAATHPRLKNYELSSEAREQQEKINQAAAENKNDEEKAEPKNTGPSVSDIVKNLNNARQQMASNADAREQLRNSLEKEYDPMGENKKKIDRIEAQVTAVGNLFLFRYFDFEVKPGLGYQYRVKVVFQNPNYKKPASQLAEGKGNTRFEPFKESAYSDPTQAAFVPLETSYFLTRFNKTIRETSLIPASVRMDIFQWIPEIGAVVHGKLKKLTVGQMVGGVDTNTDRVDWINWIRNPEEETIFNTNVMLIDIAGGGKPVSEEIARDLKLSSQQKATVGNRNEVIVVDELGRLKRLNRTSSRQGLSAAQAAWNGVEGTIALSKKETTTEDG